MLAMARRTFLTGDLLNLKIEEMDARNIRFRNDFDIAFSNATLHGLPHTERLPPNLRDPFLAEIADAYLRGHPSDHEGMIHVKMARLEVEATSLF
jgi:hypothetical protein